MSRDEPTTASKGLAASAVARVNVALPGRVVSYDRAQQRANVELDILIPRRDRDGAVTYGERVKIPNVPVAWLNGAGGALTIDLEEGDIGMVRFCDRSIDEWLLTGGQDIEVADYLRRHDFNDAVFEPVARPFVDALPSSAWAAGAAVLSGDDVRLGSSAATAYVALASLVDARLSALEAVFSAWVPAAGDGGAVLKNALTALISTGWPASVAATKVKAE